MYCPRCGNGEQLPETYCRKCGLFVPDLSKTKREIPPEEHLKANIVLSSMTVFVSFTLSFLLYLFLAFKPETHPLIYATAGLLIAIGAWHIQTLIRTLKLKRQWKRRAPVPEVEAAVQESASTAKQLNEADFANAVPVSVTENTTRHLVERSRPRES